MMFLKEHTAVAWKTVCRGRDQKPRDWVAVKCGPGEHCEGAAEGDGCEMGGHGKTKDSFIGTTSKAYHQLVGTEEREENLITLRCLP